MKNGAALSCVLDEKWETLKGQAEHVHDSIDRLTDSMNDISDKIQELSNHLEMLNTHVIPPAVEGPKRMERVLMVHITISMLALLLVGSLVVIDRVRHTGTNVDLSPSGFHVGPSPK